MAYSKLHSTLVNSSLWTEADAVRILFITLLAMCDKDGCVYGSRPGFERIAMIDPDDAPHAWDILMSPDPHSSDKMRAPENEGRRIEEIPGGFRLINFAYYRGLRNEDDRREQNRIAQARHKAKVSQGKPRSAETSHDQPKKAHTETEADADAEEIVPPTLPGSAVASGGVKEGKNGNSVPTTEQSRRMATIFHRKLETSWSVREIKAYKAIGTLAPEDLSALEAYYAALWPPKREVNVLRHDLLTFLNNITGEIDRAHGWAIKSKPKPPEQMGA